MSMLKTRKIHHIPLAQATAPPPEGTWEVLVNRWWAHQPEKGLIFYGKSPQCNRDKAIARKIQEKIYPDAETIFVERVYVRHDCQDYT